MDTHRYPVSYNGYARSKQSEPMLARVHACVHACMHVSIRVSITLASVTAGQAIDLLLKVVQSRIAPVIPSHALDRGIREGRGEERGASPRGGGGRTGNTRKRRGDVRLIPVRAG